MKKIKTNIILIILIILTSFGVIIGCNEPFEPTDEDLADLQQLVAWMTGYFDNETQYNSNPSLYWIELGMKRIWADEEEGYYLYVEQAYSPNDPEVPEYDPYRQRVYHIRVVGDNQFVSEVYEFKSDSDELDVVKAYEEEDPLSDMTLASFNKKTGCEVYLSLNQDGTAYEGGTKGKNCKTAFPGAEYATSEVTISETSFSSLDEFYDENDEPAQPEHDPYQFDLITDYDTDLNQ